MNAFNCYIQWLFDRTAHRIMCLFTILIFSFSCLFSQTTNISGIVNTYHAVLGVDAVKSAVKLDNVSGLAYGNTVLIIQMKGAAINTANSSFFGTVSAMNDVGDYEVATICSVSSDSVYFFNTILNTYDVNYKVQLVKFGEYYSANVIDTVKAQSWSNSTGKGGVLAIQVEEDLTMNAPMFADSTGYRGGSFVLSNSSCNSFTSGYIYNATNTSPQSGAYKGEGVADVVVSMSGGRGSPANGGGGGNNHNNGGGGGANLVAGGDGGGNYTTFSGACTNDYHGLAGKALNSSGGNKIFAGGGGGAGHVNNNTPAMPHDGGNGGGIIIIITKNIIGNGYKISANGNSGGNSGSDGASGGGAGGTIIMNVTNSYSGSLTIEVKGGNGGNSNNQNITNRCYGAGGGGSGGVIYFNGATPAVTTTVTAGSAGLDQGVVGCGTPAPAANGTDGSSVTSYAYRTSVTPSNTCTAPALPVRIIYFDAKLKSDKKVFLEWDIANPEEARSFTIEKLNSLNKWVEFTTIDALETIHHYETFDLSPSMGENFYRLRINSNDNSNIYSLQKRVFIKYTNSYTIYPNPATNKITIKGKLNAGSTIFLRDISGRIIHEELISIASSSIELILPQLSTGVYFIKIENEVLKLVIK
jgi:hypothetical protein